LITAEFEEAQNARAATLQRWNKILRFDLVPIDMARHCDAVLFAERLDPHTPGIVDVTGKHPDGATWGSKHRGFPEFGGQMLDEKDRDAIIGFPRVKDRIWQDKWRRHTPPLKGVQLTPNVRVDRARRLYPSQIPKAGAARMELLGQPIQRVAGILDGLPLAIRHIGDEGQAVGLGLSPSLFKGFDVAASRYNSSGRDPLKSKNFAVRVERRRWRVLYSGGLRRGTRGTSHGWGLMRSAHLGRRAKDRSVPASLGPHLRPRDKGWRRYEKKCANF
jgi:hypothetical protein